MTSQILMMLTSFTNSDQKTQNNLKFFLLFSIHFLILFFSIHSFQQRRDSRRERDRDDDSNRSRRD